MVMPFPDPPCSAINILIAASPGSPGEQESGIGMACREQMFGFLKPLKDVSAFQRTFTFWRIQLLRLCHPDQLETPSGLGVDNLPTSDFGIRGRKPAT